MQRATAAIKKSVGVASFGLVLPFVMVSACNAEAISDFNGTPIMQRWHDYALAAMTPAFSWVETAAVRAPDLMDVTFGGAASRTAFVPIGHDAFLGISVHSGVVSGLSDGARAGSLTPKDLIPDAKPGLHRYVVSSSYNRHWGDAGNWSVSALFAYQRFASATLAAFDWSPLANAQTLPVAAGSSDEISYGRGVSVEASQAIGNRLRWVTGYQSRVNMDAFNSYRGVYADPGDFDIPASATVGLDYAVTPTFGLNIGAERVMYSDIRPFTSAALPRRFLAVLGSGASPNFAWQDLTVYSVGSYWHNATLGDFSVRYSTRTQPSPTSRLLDQLLSEDYSDHSVDFTYARQIGANSRLQLVASYAPTQYLLGAPTSYSVRDQFGGNQVEFEALWAMRF
ncbi:MAG: hypothetical protein ABI411_15225 [Tahibacter sp.]